MNHSNTIYSMSVDGITYVSEALDNRTWLSSIFSVLFGIRAPKLRMILKISINIHCVYSFEK